MMTITSFRSGSCLSLPSMRSVSQTSSSSTKIAFPRSVRSSCWQGRLARRGHYSRKLVILRCESDDSGAGSDEHGEEDDQPSPLNKDVESFRSQLIASFDSQGKNSVFVDSSEDTPRRP